MTYDPVDKYVVLFGGYGKNGALNDTWKFTYSLRAGATWTNLNILGPSARYGAALTWDSAVGDNYGVLFGGCGSACPLNDTWTYLTGAWTRCTAAGCTGNSPPPARWGSTMSYDGRAGDDYVLLFGGCGRTCPLGDTWKFLASTWHKLTPTDSPPPRFGAAQDFDGNGNFTLMVGGVGSGDHLYGEYGWAFEGGAGMTWFSSNIENELPHNVTVLPRVGARLAFNTSGGYVLLFGGCEPSGSGDCGPLTTRSDTWIFQNGTWRWVCGECGPSPRWEAAMTFDAQDNYFLLFGGCRSTLGSTCSPANVLADTWKFGAGVWTQIGSGSVTARADASMAYDTLDKVVILFGGLGCIGTSCFGTWQYVGATSWSLLISSSKVPSRYGASMIAYNSSYLVLFGGANESTGSLYSDTWEFTKANGWTLVSTGNPPPRFDAGMTYDASTGWAVLFGGCGVTAVAGDTWKWVGGAYGVAGTWTQLTITLDSPGARWAVGMVFDPYLGPSGSVLMFGGSFSPEAVPGTQLQDLSPGVSETWSLLSSTSTGASAQWTDVSHYS
jgi:hypothetical protein